MRWLKQLTDYIKQMSYSIMAPWSTIEEMEFSTLEWVDRFNNRKLCESIENIHWLNLKWHIIAN